MRQSTLIDSFSFEHRYSGPFNQKSGIRATVQAIRNIVPIQLSRFPRKTGPL
jgi:hypothetical protein